MFEYISKNICQFANRNHDRYHHNKENNFSPCSEKNSSNSKNKRQEHDEFALDVMVYPLLCHPVMQVRQIAFHRIFPRTNTCQYNVKGINKINPEDDGSCGDFTTRYDRESRDDKSEKHGTSVTYDTGPLHIKSPKNK